MPSYVLHLTSAQMLLNRLPQSDSLVSDPICRNEFLTGNLMPDATDNKARTHFRNPAYRTKIMEYPDLNVFRSKYYSHLGNAFCLGYYFHLYIDRKFFKDYIPLVAEFFTEDGQITDERSLVSVTHLLRQDKYIPFSEYLSDLYYYGDYTKMSGYLSRKFQLPAQLAEPDPDRWNDPLLRELCCGTMTELLNDLKNYSSVPGEAVSDLKVFDIDDLLAFLEQQVLEFLSEMQKFRQNSVFPPSK